MTELLEGIELTELRGRRQKAMTAVVVRNLTEADLTLLKEGARQPTPPQHLKRLRDRHHTAARLAATGKSNTEISAITGMDPVRISTLRSDPAFKELVADYSKIEDSLMAEFTDRMALLSMTAVEELQDRLENGDEPLPVTSLLEIAKFGADRTGYGPQTKNTQVNVDVQLAGRLSLARKRISPPDDPRSAATEPATTLEQVVDADFTEVKPE